MLPFDSFVIPSNITFEPPTSSIQTKLKTGAISRQDYSAYLATSLESSSLQIASNEYDFSSYTYLADVIDVEEPKTFKSVFTNPL